MNYPWVSELLAGLGIMDSNLGLTAITLWAESESMPDWTINPLGAHYSLHGSSTVDITGRQQYKGFPDFFMAVENELNLPANRGIVTALRMASDYAGIWNAINSSSWSPGAQSGTYPAQLCIQAFRESTDKVILVEIARSASPAAQIARSGDFTRSIHEIANTLPIRANNTRIAADNLNRMLPG